MKKQLQLSQLAQTPQLKDYQQKPIQNYGMSLLKGMGFDQSRGIGKRKTNQLSDIFVLKPRPKGLGLGAEVPQQQKRQKLQIGDRILITNDPHKGLIGIINQIVDEQTFTIELYPSKSIVKINAKCLKKISKQQMKKIKQQKQKQEGEKKKKKRLKWVLPNIRVKVTDSQSENYLKKVIITDLISQRQFQCRGENGQTINSLGESDIQTVLPKAGGVVLILKGSHKGCKAIVVERKKLKGKVTVQTVQQLELIQFSEDDICQYVQN